MGTPEFAVPSLLALIETQHVVGVVTQPDKPSGRGNVMRASPVKLLAQSAGIPVYQPRSLKQEEAAEPLQAWRPDAIVVAAFGQILRPHVLGLPPAGCINVHASLLPRWRGASPIQHAILAGDTDSGITLMLMDEGLDTGPVFIREALLIGERETATSLHDRLAVLGAKLLRQHLDNILAGHILAYPQDHDASTYAPMIRKEAGQIDWAQGSIEIDRLIRAMTPWPGAYTGWQGEMLKIDSARPVLNHLPLEEPGRVVVLNQDVAVLTGNGALILERVQLAGKRALSISDFLRGRPEFLGAILGHPA
jgi:methionyl-tRNA formyltransferase